MILCVWHQKHKEQKQVGLYETKKCLHSKGNKQQGEKKLMGWEKIFANYVSDKALISKMFKGLLKLYIVKMGEELEPTFLRRGHTSAQPVYDNNKYFLKFWSNL